MPALLSSASTSAGARREGKGAVHSEKARLFRSTLCALTSVGSQKQQRACLTDLAAPGRTIERLDERRVGRVHGDDPPGERWELPRELAEAGGVLRAILVDDDFTEGRVSGTHAADALRLVSEGLEVGVVEDLEVRGHVELLKDGLDLPPEELATACHHDEVGAGEVAGGPEGREGGARGHGERRAEGLGAAPPTAVGPGLPCASGVGEQGKAGVDS